MLLERHLRRERRQCERHAVVVAKVEVWKWEKWDVDKRNLSETVGTFIGPKTSCSPKTIPN